MNEAAHLPAETTWFARLLTHMAWADQGLLDAVEAHPSQAAVRLLGHVVVAERIWLGRIRGEDLPLTPWEPRDLPAIRGLVQETRDGFASFVAGLDPARLTESVRYRNSRGEEQILALGDILLHAALHGAHHRGQICTLLAREGKAPALDHFLFAMGNPLS